MGDLGTGCLSDILFNWLIPKTPWRLFVVLVVLASAALIVVAILQP